MSSSPFLFVMFIERYLLFGDVCLLLAVHSLTISLRPKSHMRHSPLVKQTPLMLYVWVRVVYPVSSSSCHSSKHSMADFVVVAVVGVAGYEWLRDPGAMYVCYKSSGCACLSKKHNAHSSSDWFSHVSSVFFCLSVGQRCDQL